MTYRLAARRKDDGFTLAELLVIVAVVGILAGIALPLVLSQEKKAGGAVAVSSLRDASTAEEAQLSASGAYTSLESALETQGYRPSSDMQLGLAVSPTGYCEVATQSGKFWWFDSGAGGLQAETTSTLTPPTSADASCSVASPQTVG
jgi:type IV pilus assembly protein PilA